MLTSFLTSSGGVTISQWNFSAFEISKTGSSTLFETISPNGLSYRKTVQPLFSRLTRLWVIIIIATSN
ncbi:hypothetical protein D3C78_1882340 [compost metagenome]